MTRRPTTVVIDEDPRDIPEPDDPELLYYRNRVDEFVPQAKHEARVLKRTRKMARKPTGIPYYGIPPEWFTGWVYNDSDDVHSDWDQEAFVKGGWSK